MLKVANRYCSTPITKINSNKHPRISQSPKMPFYKIGKIYCLRSAKAWVTKYRAHSNLSLCPLASVIN